MNLNRVFFLIFCFTLSITACKKNDVSKEQKIEAVAFESYEEEWIQIAEMEEKGLGKAIIEKTNEILQKAIKDGNSVQIFKAMAVRSKYENNVEEESTFNILSQFEERISQSEFPLRQLLHSATAELYFQYYNQNRWRFNQRTETVNFDEQDLRSWSLQQILDKIDYHYTSSLLAKEQLVQVPLRSYKEIINFPEEQNDNLASSKAYDASDLRPSLFDFLSDRALTYYKRNEGRVNRPIDEFNTDDFAVFSSIENYIEIEFQTPDSSSSSFKAALIYQNLLKVHAKDVDANVRIDFNLARLEHFYVTSKNDSKDSLYHKALLNFFNKNQSAEVAYKIAQLYYRWGSRYAAGSEENKETRWYISKAYKLCKQFDEESTYGGIMCSNLMREMERIEFNFNVEKVYLPDESLLYHLAYRNLDSIYFNLVQVPSDFQVGYETDEFLKEIAQKPAVRSWSQQVTNFKDFQMHSMEMSMEKLPKGKYVLIGSSSKAFKKQKDFISYSPFVVSELSYISNQDKNTGNFLLYVLNRSTGKPTKNAEVTVFREEYDYRSRSRKIKEIGNYNSDANGEVVFKIKERQGGLQVRVLKGSDTLMMGNNYYAYYNGGEARTYTQTHFFTDRAIYRPGQTVYFKGIVIEKGNRSSKVKSDFSTEVSLFNVNNEKLSTVEVTTNEYGSYQGSFVLPTSGLNGQYRIRDKNGGTYFSVEEYKRPTFKVSLDTSNATQKINTPIELSGEVEAFSGAKVSSAKLNYRVVRRATYPYWGYFRSFMPPTNEKEIANGVLETDENGHFQFSFLAKADESLKSEWNPTYNYEVIIDATSPSGETQSLTESIKIGSQAVYLSTNLGDALQLKGLKQLKVFAKNTYGKEVDSKIMVKLWSLETPKKVKKSKFWAATDLKSIERNEYKSSFPLYPMEEENKMDEFERDKLLLGQAVNANTETNLFGDLKQGAYEIELQATDRFGNEVVHKERFKLYDENSGQLAYPQFIFLEPIKDKGEPGETAEFLIGSSLKGLRLLYEVRNDDKLVSRKWMTLSDEQKKINIPIKEEYRGNFSVHFIGVHSNRVIQLNRRVEVPFSNKKLLLKLGTYRDKVQPGSKEKWTMTVSGLKGDKVASELLISMYDQSLDQFKKKDWELNLYQMNSMPNAWTADRGFSSNSSRAISSNLEDFIHTTLVNPIYPNLNWFGFSLSGRYYLRDGVALQAMSAPASKVREDADYEIAEEVLEESVSNQSGSFKFSEDKSKEKKEPAINPVRKDFRETAFFIPQLKTNQDGSASFEFTMPEALTQWRFRALAHTKSLKVGTTEKSIRTQKELMVVPNMPRFFREQDELNITTLINNLSEQTQSGSADIRFFDAFTDRPVDLLNGSSVTQKFNVLSQKNTTVSWKVRIPLGIKAIKYSIKATSQSFSDGEEKVIPVLLNRTLVTESLPLAVRGNQTKNFEFEKLKQTSSSSLKHEAYTLEFTSNPAWYAVQALPYISETNSECSEQIFSRLYANSLAESIANSNPRIQEVFKLWKNSDSKELTSKLFQNQELKSILIEETPWLQLAKSESEQKKMIAMLFDYNRMAQEKEATIKKLKQLQLPNGGWSWYKGMQDSRHITQYIVNGFGHLKKLGIDYTGDPEVGNMLKRAIDYLDDRIKEDYKRLTENKTDLSKDHLGYYQIHYLYTRSFFQEVSLPKEKTAFNYYLKQAEKYWLSRNIYMKGMIALSLQRYNGESEVAKLITNSLKDNALQTESLGMYWKNNRSGYYWYNSAIETQALMIELFNEVAKDKLAVEELKIWLLKQKQTQMWSNSKSTAVACYALLLDNLQLTNTNTAVKITVGGAPIIPDQVEAGTGYFKENWEKSKINSTLGSIKVEKNSDGVAWGAAYWQYYEDLDKITSADVEELTIAKTLFKVIVNDKGEQMQPIGEETVQVGDKIRVRIRIESKRDLEFVHLKDMRASGFEPVNVLSRYKYQDGLGYYESTKDASTNFFMDRLSKGVYVFEYDLRATVKGDYSNGISTLQCQYAPEFSSHSKGRRVKIAQ